MICEMQKLSFIDILKDILIITEEINLNVVSGDLDLALKLAASRNEKFEKIIALDTSFLNESEKKHAKTLIEEIQCSDNDGNKAAFQKKNIIWAEIFKLNKNKNALSKYTENKL